MDIYIISNFQCYINVAMNILIHFSLYIHKGFSRVDCLYLGIEMLAVCKVLVLHILTTTCFCRL